MIFVTLDRAGNGYILCLISVAVCLPIVKISSPDIIQDINVSLTLFSPLWKPVAQKKPMRLTLQKSKPVSFSWSSTLTLESLLINYINLFTSYCPLSGLYCSGGGMASHNGHMIRSLSQLKELLVTARSVGWDGSAHNHMSLGMHMYSGWALMPTLLDTEYMS